MSCLWLAGMLPSLQMEMLSLFHILSSGSLLSLHKSRWKVGQWPSLLCSLSSPAREENSSRPAEKWEYKGWFRSSRSSLGSTWQRLPIGKNVPRASGLLLAPGVVAGCTGALLWELSPSSGPPWLSGSVLCKKSSLLFPATHVIQPLPACASSHNLPLNAARWSELAHAPCRHLQLPALGEHARLTCCWSGLHHACGRWGMFGCCRGWL